MFSLVVVHFFISLGFCQVSSVKKMFFFFVLLHKVFFVLTGLLGRTHIWHPACGTKRAWAVGLITDQTRHQQEIRMNVHKLS